MKQGKKTEYEKEQGSATEHSALLRHNARALTNQIVCYIPVIAAEGSTLFLTICFSRTSPFSVELCIAERQLDFAGVRIFRFMTFFDVAEILL